MGERSREPASSEQSSGTNANSLRPGQAIAPSLFRALADSPRLCALVHKLEIRVFPLSMILTERLEMEAQAVKVILQAVNVRQLIWTRKGALTDRCVLASPSGSEELRSAVVRRAGCSKR
jgi:hypothetical protein